jgi:hypothetical protein
MGSRSPPPCGSPPAGGVGYSLIAVPVIIHDCVLGTSAIDMTAIEAVVRDPSGPDATLRLALACILLTPLWVLAIAVVASRDVLASVFGEWIPRIQLHLQFNSACFLLVFLPCTLVLYALYRTTALATGLLPAPG